VENDKCVCARVHVFLKLRLGRVRFESGKFEKKENVKRAKVKCVKVLILTSLSKHHKTSNSCMKPGQKT